MFEECDGRLINQENNDQQGSAPVPGTCVSDGTVTQESRLVSIGGETRLRVDVHVEYDMNNWPTGQDMFFDMTTEPPEIDDPPMWTTAAPTEGDIMTIADDGVAYFVSTGQMAAWATDDQGSPLISCSGAEGWSMNSDGDGLYANAPAGQDVQLCPVTQWTPLGKPRMYAISRYRSLCESQGVPAVVLRQ